MSFLEVNRTPEKLGKWLCGMGIGYILFERFRSPADMNSKRTVRAAASDNGAGFLAGD